MTIKLALPIAIGLILNCAINRIKIRKNRKDCVYDEETRGWHKI